MNMGPFQMIGRSENFAVYFLDIFLSSEHFHFRNITRDHLTEIFGTYGKIVTVDLPGGSGMSFTFRHSATIEFESHEDAAKAVKVFRLLLKFERSP